MSAAAAAPTNAVDASSAIARRRMAYPFSEPIDCDRKFIRHNGSQLVLFRHPAWPWPNPFGCGRRTTFFFAPSTARQPLETLDVQGHLDCSCYVLIVQLR